MLKNIPPNERPQERLERLGASALSERELIAMILRTGTTKNHVLNIADEILSKAGSLSGLLRWDVSDFMQTRGIGKVKGLQLSILIEVAKRMIQGQRTSDITFDEPQKVWDYLFPEVRSSIVEKVWVFCLDRKNKLLRAELVTSGTATGSLVHPREVFRPAIRHGASAIILAHNHPSGDPSPSTADLNVTKRILESSKSLGIDMHDHVIVGEPENCPNALGYYSFCEAGII